MYNNKCAAIESKLICYVGSRIKQEPFAGFKSKVFLVPVYMRLFFITVKSSIHVSLGLMWMYLEEWYTRKVASQLEV